MPASVSVSVSVVSPSVDESSESSSVSYSVSVAAPGPRPSLGRVDALVSLSVPSSTETITSSAVGNVSGYRCMSDCRSRGREFDPGPVPYFRGD